MSWAKPLYEGNIIYSLYVVQHKYQGSFFPYVREIDKTFLHVPGKKEHGNVFKCVSILFVLHVKISYLFMCVCCIPNIAYIVTREYTELEGFRVGLGVRNFKGVNCHEQFVYIDIIQAFRDAFFSILDYNK